MCRTYIAFNVADESTMQGSVRVQHLILDQPEPNEL